MDSEGTDAAASAKPSWLIQSVVRLASILDLFTTERPTWSEHEIVQATGLSRGTVYRFCQTLRHVGYLEQSDPGQFRPGPRALTLGQAAIGSFDLAEVARPTLLQLHARLNETVNMAIPDGGDIVYVIRLRGPGLLDIRLQVGSRLPAYCSSLGRVMLAQRPAEEVAVILENDVRVAHTEKTVTDTHELQQILARVRAQGYAVNDGELAYGLRGIAAPICYPDGKPAAAINVALTRPFREGEIEQSLAPLLIEAATRIEALLMEKTSQIL